MKIKTYTYKILKKVFLKKEELNFTTILNNYKIYLFLFFYKNQSFFFKNFLKKKNNLFLKKIFNTKKKFFSIF